MATSSDADASKEAARRSKSPGKAQAEKQQRKSRAAEPEKMCGFHPLLYLRNIFFGYRTRDKPKTIEQNDEKSHHQKAKSTDNLTRDIDAEERQPITTQVSSTATQNRHRIGQLDTRLSVSADNLVSEDKWVPAGHGIPSKVGGMNDHKPSDQSRSEQNILNGSRGKTEDATVMDTASVDQFFKSSWLEVPSSRTRAFSSGDVHVEEGNELNFDLDAVGQTTALDVRAVKDRIALKPKGHRVTLAMQQKLANAEVRTSTTTTTTNDNIKLPVPMETDRGDQGNMHKEVTRQSSSGGNSSRSESSAPPERPIRREKNPLAPPKGLNSNYRQTIGITITPDMLNRSALKKKPSDRSSCLQMPKPDVNDDVFTPSDGRKNNRTEEESETKSTARVSATGGIRKSNAEDETDTKHVVRFGSTGSRKRSSTKEETEIKHATSASAAVGSRKSNSEEETEAKHVVRPGPTGGIRKSSSDEETEPKHAARIGGTVGRKRSSTDEETETKHAALSGATGQNTNAHDKDEQSLDNPTGLLRRTTLGSIDEEKIETGARPKVPPKVLPKTRPKTMMHPPSKPEEGEWGKK